MLPVAIQFLFISSLSVAMSTSCWYKIKNAKKKQNKKKKQQKKKKKKRKKKTKKKKTPRKQKLDENQLLAILSDELRTLHMRWHGHGHAEGTYKEKLNRYR